jgi:Methyltransferase domain
MTEITDHQIRALPGNDNFSGGLWNPDLGMFRFLLEQTATRLGGGDLAEIGGAWGHTAVLIGSYAAPDETFTVVDLWEQGAGDADNERENAQSYTGLTRAAFEANYLSLLPTLPVLIQDFSSAIADQASHGTHRFLHVDASHLYDHVRQDAQSARLLAKPGGVVVFDDYRAEHCPGTAAAVWEAVLRDVLRPFAVTPFKLYATWDDTVDWRPVLRDWLPGFGCEIDPHVIAGHEVLRVVPPRTWGRHPAKDFLPPVAVPALKLVRNRIRQLQRGR